MAIKISLINAYWVVLLLSIGMSIGRMITDTNGAKAAIQITLIFISFAGLFMVLSIFLSQSKNGLPSPDDWVLEQIAKQFKTYKDAVAYFNDTCNCISKGSVCVAEAITWLITADDELAYIEGDIKLKRLIHQYHPTNYQPDIKPEEEVNN